jgi:hypothetical protein
MHDSFFSELSINTESSVHRFSWWALEFEVISLQIYVLDNEAIAYLRLLYKIAIPRYLSDQSGRLNPIQQSTHARSMRVIG